MFNSLPTLQKACCFNPYDQKELYVWVIIPSHSRIIAALSIIFTHCPFFFLKPLKTAARDHIEVSLLCADNKYLRYHGHRLTQTGQQASFHYYFFYLSYNQSLSFFIRGRCLLNPWSPNLPVNTLPVLTPNTLTICTTTGPKQNIQTLTPSINEK